MFDSRVWPSLVVASFMGLSNAGLVLTSSIFVKDVILTNQSEVYSTVAVGFSIVALASMFSQLVIVQNYRINPLSLIKWGLLIVFLGFFLLSQASSIWVISRFNVKRSWYGFGKSRKCDNAFFICF